tara:strand:- start:321 stop:1094 length:774 start_codon:yes stop_codon:yes gene_type:complete
MKNSSLVSLEQLDISIPGKILVQNLTASFKNSEFIAILGRNGTGKSLTLHTIAGLRDSEKGEIVLGQDNLKNLNRREIAIRLSLLTQDSEDILPSTVYDTASIGRHPHKKPFSGDTENDMKMTLDSLCKVSLENKLEQDIHSLSGGEKRRLSIAQVLNQNAKIFLLDEPTNHLDPLYQYQILDTFKKLTKKNYLVIATMHDPNLISRYADKCLLLYGDGCWILGETDDVMSEENLSRLYGIEMQKIRKDGRTLFIAK